MSCTYLGDKGMRACQLKEQFIPFGRHYLTLKIHGLAGFELCLRMDGEASVHCASLWPEGALDACRRLRHGGRLCGAILQPGLL